MVKTLKKCTPNFVPFCQGQGSPPATCAQQSKLIGSIEPIEPLQMEPTGRLTTLQNIIDSCIIRYHHLSTHTNFLVQGSKGTSLAYSLRSLWIDFTFFLPYLHSVCYVFFLSLEQSQNMHLYYVLKKYSCQGLFLKNKFY